MTKDPRKSDGLVVPMKSSNKGAVRPAETMEGRRPAKGNADEQTTLRTQSRAGVPPALERVRQAAKKDRNAKFTALFHHLTLDRLRSAFDSLERGAAAGVDGVTWQEYAEHLEDNLQTVARHKSSASVLERPTAAIRDAVAAPDSPAVWLLTSDHLRAIDRMRSFATKARSQRAVIGRRVDDTTTPIHSGDGVRRDAVVRRRQRAGPVASSASARPASPCRARGACDRRGSRPRTR
jgi:hypothetical protein